MYTCMCESVCACMYMGGYICMLDVERTPAHIPQVVVQIAMYLTAYSDCLTYFFESLLPLYG